MPSLDASALAEIGNYLELASSLGKFLAKLGPINPDALRVSYHGGIAEKDTSLISRTLLTGYLEAARPDGQVNIVNSPSVARDMGLEIIESTIHAQTEYSELIVAELKKGNTRYRIAGTIIGKSPRIVEIDRLFVDTDIKGNFLIVSNDDRPGIVGLVGSAIGTSGLNIANLSLARNKSEGNALSVIQLDSPPTQAMVEELSKAPGILSVKAIEI